MSAGWKSLAFALTLGLASAQSWRSLPGSIYPEDPWGQCTITSWPVSNIGQPLQPQEPDDELRGYLSQVDPARIQAIVQNLTNFGTRHTLSSQTDPVRGIGAARDWIYQQMLENAASSNGNQEVYFDSYIQGVANRITFPVNITNVVARINGTTDPNRVYVVTGHYDSRRIDINDYTGDAPGSDDDASGTAVVIELARIFATTRPASTLIFAATAAEEQGLYGATHLASTLRAGGFNVEGNFNNDIVGTGANDPTAPINNHTIRVYGANYVYPNTSYNPSLTTIGGIGGENDSPARNLGRYVAEIAAGASEETDAQIALIYRFDRYLRGGDHSAFTTNGFPAVRFTEAVEDFKHEHQDPRVQDGIQYGDLPEFVDYDYVARVARVNAAAMWSAANAPRLPRNVTISSTVGFPAASESTPADIVSNDSQFSFATDNDPLAAGYELVWRAQSGLQWTNSLALEGSPATVNLNKDQLAFGIRAVGADGRKSPAVLPLPG